MYIHLYAFKIKCMIVNTGDQVLYPLIYHSTFTFDSLQRSFFFFCIIILFATFLGRMNTDVFRTHIHEHIQKIRNTKNDFEHFKTDNNLHEFCIDNRLIKRAIIRYSFRLSKKITIKNTCQKNNVNGYNIVNVIST